MGTHWRAAASCDIDASKASKVEGDDGVDTGNEADSPETRLGRGMAFGVGEVVEGVNCVMCLVFGLNGGNACAGVDGKVAVDPRCCCG